MGGANEISRTANHLSTLQPATDEQSCNTEEVARGERIDWRLEGAVGGQLSVIQPGAHLFTFELGDPLHGGGGGVVQDSDE